MEGRSQEPIGGAKRVWAGEVVGNPAHVATHSGWIKEAGMIRSKNEGSGGEGVSTFTADGVEEAKERVGKDAAAVKPDGANLHGTVGRGGAAGANIANDLIGQRAGIIFSAIEELGIGSPQEWSGGSERSRAYRGRPSYLFPPVFFVVRLGPWGRHR